MEEEGSHKFLYILYQNILMLVFFKKPNNSKSMSAFILKHELSTNKNENVCAQFQTFKPKYTLLFLHLTSSPWSE